MRLTASFPAGATLTGSRRGAALLVAEVVKRSLPDGLYSLFLDFDGTLVPIAADPATPRLDSATRETLRYISKKRRWITAIISGRAVDDLTARIGLDGLIYAGNHGLEIRGCGLNFIEPVAAAQRERLKRLSDELAGQLKMISGALVEYKGLSTSIHFRLVRSDDLAHVEGLVRAAVAGEAGFYLNTGKKVFEILPQINWHKGTAAQWINRQFGVDQQQTIYIGDDTTDENAFSVLTRAVTVNVGEPGVTGARYQLPDPEAVHEFLNWLAGFQGGPPRLLEDG